MVQQELHLVLVSNEPARAYPAIQLALGAAAMGHKVKVYATTAGLDVVKKGTVDQIHFPGFPPLKEVLQDAIKMGVRGAACAPSGRGDVLDPRGLLCPYPYIRARQALEALPAGASLVILTDSEPTATSSIPVLCEQQGYALACDRAGAEWRLIVTKP